MAEIRFEDGAAYERFMGVWSRKAGDVFLDWLAAPAGLRWLDVGCGNGAFTGLLLERAAPAFVEGVDPSEAQLAYAREHIAPSSARFHKGDAAALSFPDRAFDAAVMPLVLFFVKEAGQAVAEMARVVRSGGIVCAYSWDMTGGGLPYAPLQRAMRECGADVAMPPNPEAAQMDNLRRYWTDAGLRDLALREIVVQRTFEDFEDYWTTVQGGPSMRAGLAALSPAAAAALRARMQSELAADAAGRITCTGRAHAVKGIVP